MKKKHWSGLFFEWKLKHPYRCMAGSNQIQSKLNAQKASSGFTIAFCFSLEKMINDCPWMRKDLKYELDIVALGKYLCACEERWWKKCNVHFWSINAKFTNLPNLILIWTSFSFDSTHWMPIQLFQSSRIESFSKCIWKSRGKTSFLFLLTSDYIYCHWQNLNSHSRPYIIFTIRSRLYG